MFKRGVISLVVVLAAGTAACSGGGGGGDEAAKQPPPQETLRQAAQAMGNLRSVAFNVATEGNPGVPLKGGDLRLLRDGDAEGTINLEQSGQAVEMKIVAVGDAFYVKGVTGGWRKFPKQLASAMYDPSAVLDPQRGIAKLLTSVAQPQAEKTEKVDGKDAYKVRGTLPKDVIAGLIPGLNGDVKGHVWVSTADHRLLKVRGDVNDGAVTVRFTEFDAPYKISAPA
ncbi:LppX_LprAFG lipoprotein [Actinomadura keratinilytica]|jgi:lipoprotein LprG|uniref:LppX_LprAFG lipoprotein n=1 Tax=Actinomadura keratinilytica TaxID=547461 RepID=A0ABP7Z3M7_9ACTN